MAVVFKINRKEFCVNADTVSVDTSLNNFIRNHAHLSGTKWMCLEGGCGACVVNVSGPHPVTGEVRSYSVNSCLFPILSCHGLEITTIEGIGNKRDGYHPAQKVLAHFNGSQCGFCSPGMVMNMYGLLKTKKGQVTMSDVENSFGGNICRCTGYRPILDAFKSLAIDAEPRLREACEDIEDLTMICRGKHFSCAEQCLTKNRFDGQRITHLKFIDGTEWYKVYTINDIFAVFERIGTLSYTLLAGNTAHGVYRKREDLQVYIDITSVKELRSHTLVDKICVGGNVTLTEFRNILSEAAKIDDNFRYCIELVKHIDLIANVPVRNTGTIAGNLGIKNQHKEFPSDLYLILEAIGATLTIMDCTQNSINVTPAQYSGINMTKKIIVNIAMPRLHPKEYIFRSFIIMPRAQNAHAYVNGAFLFKLNLSRTRVESVTICFGGISANFTHAMETEKYLIGENIFDNRTIQKALGILFNELRPDKILPAVCPNYRRNLACSLFYKSILSIASEFEIPIKPEFISGGTVLTRQISTADQYFDTYRENWPLTMNIPKIEGLAQAAGEAKYVNDISLMPHELHAAFVVATEVHARIANIDAYEALNLPGVVAFYTAKDIPGNNDFMPFKDIDPEVEEIFCSDKVLYHGQPVGILVADSLTLAYRACRLVKITYESCDETILPTVKEVIKAEAKDRIISTDHGYVGANYDKFSEGPIKLTGELTLGTQYHFSLEPQSCICVPIEDGMDVYSSTQWLDLVQVAIARVLNIPECCLNVHVRRVGGSYGGKASRSALVACACALAAHLLQRPVRLIMTLESNMAVIGKRYGLVSEYEASVSKEGLIEKLHNKFTHDSGCNYNETPFYISNSYSNCYGDETWKIEALNARTDSASNTWCRAPGSTEAVAMIETIMEHVAHATGLDPVDVRMRNIPANSKMKELLPQFRVEVQYDKRKVEIEHFNSQNRWRKRGIAIVPMRYPVGYLGSLHALVSIYHGDGTVSIAHGGIEMGQGLNTKASQVAAHVLGIPMEMISIKSTNNLVSPNAVCTQASFTSEAVGYAIKIACEILLHRLKPIRERNVNAAWPAIVAEAFKGNVDLSATYMYKASELQPYTVWGISCAEVEIDVLTGNIQISRVDIVEDTGESLSPGIDIGQIEGAFVMGIGYYLTETMAYDPQDGALLTNRTWNYKPPGAKDIPIDFRIRFLRNSSNPAGVLRSKTTGEPAIVMSVVVLCALRHALMAARKDACLPNEWVSLGAPTTPERIYQLAGNCPDQYELN